MTAIHFVNLLSIICNVFLFGLCCICTALAYGKAKGHKPADTLIMLRSVLWGTKAETTLEDYIGNILINHLGTHLELIKKIEDKQKP